VVYHDVNIDDCAGLVCLVAYREEDGQKHLSSRTVICADDLSQDNKSRTRWNLSEYRSTWL
jgi:hypothetical protein